MVQIKHIVGAEAYRKRQEEVDTEMVRETRKAMKPGGNFGARDGAEGGAARAGERAAHVG